MIKKVKSTGPWAYVISILNGKVVGAFYKNFLQKSNQKEFTIVKVINRKGDKLFAKWKGNINSFNSWINTKYILYMSEFSPKRIFLRSKCNF